MKTKNYDSGFTLLEILVTILLLGIIATAVIPAIGSSVVNIITVGIDDQALNAAANFTEIIQQKIIVSGEEITENEWENLSNETITFRNQTLDIIYKDCATVENNPAATKIQFCKEKISNGYKIKVVFFYNNGDKNIILNSFATYKRG